MSRIKNFSINILLVISSILLFLLFLEFVVFRVVLLPTELPRLDFVNGVIKYEPDQIGIFRVKDEIAARYRVNSSGWNSAHDKYELEKNKDKFRIAVIGDSYVEGHVLDFDSSLSEKLELKLGRERNEVYRFGISGAPMSQYLHMLRNEVIRYQPDAVVVILVHNDFDESYEFLKGSYASNFMKLKIDGDAVVEQPPRQFQRPWYTTLRESATWRYLVFRQKLSVDYLKNLILGNKIYYQGNISIDSINAKRDKNTITANYVLGKMKEICDSSSADLLVVMGSVTEVVYGLEDKDESYRSGALGLNLIAEEATKRHGIGFIDMEPVFEDDYRENQRRLTFIHDGHWNEYAHELVADAVYQYLKNERAGFEKY